MEFYIKCLLFYFILSCIIIIWLKPKSKIQIILSILFSPFAFLIVNIYMLFGLIHCNNGKYKFIFKKNKED